MEKDFSVRVSQFSRKYIVRLPKKSRNKKDRDDHLGLFYYAVENASTFWQINSALKVKGIQRLLFLKKKAILESGLEPVFIKNKD
jgi:hypothetical protein